MIVAVLYGSISTVCSIVKGFKGCRRLAAISVCATEDVVSTHLLVASAVAVEPFGEVAGQGVVEHQAVGTVLPLQLGELKTRPLAVVAGDKEQDGKKHPNGWSQHQRNSRNCVQNYTKKESGQRFMLLFCRI